MITEILAAVLIALGIYLIISGLREKPEEKLYEYDRDLERYYENERYYEREKPEKSVKGGGVLIIGPIPIVFGEARIAVLALILAIVLMLVSIFFLILQHA